METKILKINDENIENGKIQYAAKILSEGGTVVFPTETVYGLGANALKVDCVKKIFNAKGRPTDNPLIVHVSSVEDIKFLAQNIPQNIELIAKNFWPGPITIILNKKDIVPKVTTGGLSTVAIRIPNNKIALSLIKESGVPIAAPSANISGKPSPTCAEHVINDLFGRVDVIVDGGCTQVGVESTVLDLTSEVPTILRPGGITFEQLKDVLGKVNIDKTLLKRVDDIKPLSPGMKYTHYSPDAEVIIVSGEKQKTISKINTLCNEYEKQNKKVGILATDNSRKDYTYGHIISVGNEKNLDEIASKIFTVLREFDSIGVDVILSESFTNEGIGFAIMNRLSKAAGYNIIKV